MKTILELTKDIKNWYLHSITDNGCMVFRSTEEKPSATEDEFVNAKTGKQMPSYNPNGNTVYFACAVLRYKKGDVRVTRSKKELLSLAWEHKGSKIFRLGHEPLKKDGTSYFKPAGKMCSRPEKQPNGEMMEVESDTFQWLARA